MRTGFRSGSLSRESRSIRGCWLTSFRRLRRRIRVWERYALRYERLMPPSRLAWLTGLQVAVARLEVEEWRRHHQCGPSCRPPDPDPIAQLLSVHVKERVWRLRPRRNV